jgi:hypothetical protein
MPEVDNFQASLDQTGGFAERGSAARGECHTACPPPAKKQRQQWQQHQQLQPNNRTGGSSSRNNSSNHNSTQQPPRAQTPRKEEKGGKRAAAAAGVARMTSRKQSDRRGKRIEFCTSFPTPCEQRSGTSTTCASYAEEGTEPRCAPTSSIGPLEDCMRWQRAEGE